MISSTDVSKRLIDLILARKLLPGAPLNKQLLERSFDCQRYIAEETLARLGARKIVVPREDKSWTVLEPSREEARETLEARRVIEPSLIRSMKAMNRKALKSFKTHLTYEKVAASCGDPDMSSFLSGLFHIRLAEHSGNRLLADTVRYLVARTTLVAVQHRAPIDAFRNYDDHAQIVAALEAHDLATAEKLIDRHLGTMHAQVNSESICMQSAAQIA